MTVQTQDLDIRRDIGLLKVGKAFHGHDMIGLGVPVGHTHAALSATVTVAKEGECLGVHAAWASTFQEVKVDCPIEVFEIATSARPIGFGIIARLSG